MAANNMENGENTWSRNFSRKLSFNRIFIQQNLQSDDVTTYLKRLKIRHVADKGKRKILWILSKTELFFIAKLNVKNNDRQ